MPGGGGAARHPSNREAQGPASEERLIASVAPVLARDGYALLTVATLVAQARVSRATFYQYFADVQDCFLTAYRREGERLVHDVRSVSGAGVERELAVVRHVVNVAVADPLTARLLMCEGLAAGPQGVLERDALIAQIALALDRDNDPSTARLDLPASVLIGGVFRFLALRLSEQSPTAALREGVERWANVFVRGPGDRSWATDFMPRAPRPHTPPGPARTRTAAPGGTRRERLIRATAATVRDRGYSAVTVADIVEAAHVSRRAFYDEFHSKADAYIASYEHAFQECLAACTPAFFSTRRWPERIWEAALGFTGFFSREPLLAHLGFVECYSLGPDFATRAHETHLAFTLFLEDGYRQRPEAELLPRACSTLTMAAIFEAAFQVSRWGAALHMRRMQPLAVYIALAPFIGADEAGEFVEQKLASSAAARSCRAA